MNLVNNLPPHNFYFVGGSRCSSPSIVLTPTPRSNQNQIVVENEEEAVRTEKRILWMQEEDVRLVIFS